MNAPCALPGQTLRALCAAHGFDVGNYVLAHELSHVVIHGEIPAQHGWLGGSIT
jgi:hypothetical protein